MNFQSLKWMIDSLVKTYKCPECNHDVSEKNVDIVWAAGSTINIDVECPSCKRHSMVRTEVLSVDLANGNISKDKINTIKEAIKGIKKSGIIKNIKDEEIVELNKELKKEDLSVDDLFQDNSKK